LPVSQSRFPSFFENGLQNGNELEDCRQFRDDVDIVGVGPNKRQNHLVGLLHVSGQLHLDASAEGRGQRTVIGRPGKNNDCALGSDSMCSQHILL
jgi:hypothetical protein